MNPIMAILGQMMKGGENQQQMIQQIMGNNQMMNNPMARNAMEMFQKGDMKGLQSMAENLAKEKGTSIEDVKNSLMKRFGMN